MAKIALIDGKLPKNLEGFCVYILDPDDDPVLREISGFTTEGNLFSAKYLFTRMNAGEFGKVSSQCKCFRVALQTVLPKRNNLAVVNAFTKKMRVVMSLDDVSFRGERNLATAFRNENAKEAMIDYNFNPDAAFKVAYTWVEHNIKIILEKVVVSKYIRTLGLRIHVLGFDFEDGSSELVSSAWNFYSRKFLPKEIMLRRPALNNDFAVKFVILEVAFFEIAGGCIISLQNDGEKLVQVVGVF